MSRALILFLAGGVALMAALREATAHEHHPAGGGYTRSFATYTVPDVTLVASDGLDVPLRTVLDRGGPVALNFVFTSCRSICPVMSAAFAQLRDQLGGQANTVQFVSISIDPDHDTPSQLAAYAKRYRAGARWLFLTGERASIVRVQQAFDVYRGSKVEHAPFTFLRRAPDEPWVRIEGFAGAAELAREIRRAPPP